MFDLIPCQEFPFLMIAVALLGAAVFIFGWARYDPPPVPAWRWGDKPRRQPRINTSLLTHMIGGFFAALATVYALNHPICG